MTKANVYVTAGIRVTCKNGKMISDKTFRSKSLVRQWQRALWAAYSNTAQNVVDTGNTPRALNEHSFHCDSVAAGDDYGIILGRDATPVTMADYVLGTPVVEGVGVNQLNYALTVITHAEAAGGDYVQIQRVATNNSAADVTIEEIGLYGLSAPDAWYFMMIRDVTGPTLVVVGASATVTFQIHNNL